MSQDQVKLGCLGWVAAVLTFSWLLSLTPLSDDAAIVGGVVAACLLVVGLQFRHGWRQEMAKHDAAGRERQPSRLGEFAKGFWNGLRGR